MDPDVVGIEDIHATLNTQRASDPDQDGALGNPSEDVVHRVAGDEGATNSIVVSGDTTGKQVLLENISHRDDAGDPSPEAASVLIATARSPPDARGSTRIQVNSPTATEKSSVDTLRAAAAAATTGAEAADIAPDQAAGEDSLYVDGVERTQTGGGHVVAVAALRGDLAQEGHAPTTNTAQQRVASDTRPSSNAGSSSGSSEGSAGTDAEERSSSGGNEERDQDSDADGCTLDHSSDLDTQLKRLWGGSPPNQAEELTVMRDILGHREELDNILSRLMVSNVSIATFHKKYAAKVSCTLPLNPNQADSEVCFVAETLYKNTE